jgi:GNAT superfamily N-acetyltransferase
MVSLVLYAHRKVGNVLCDRDVLPEFLEKIIRDFIMTIRQATLDDIPEITGLWTEFMDFHQSMNTFFTRRSDGDVNFRDHVVDNLSNPDFCIIVADLNGTLTGYAIAYFQDYPPVFVDKKCAYISDIVVDESYRGKGLGKELIDFLCDWARSRGIQRMELEVLQSNYNAHAFYDHLGFEPFMHKLVRLI